jgi:hypothetical protein
MGPGRFLVSSRARSLTLRAFVFVSALFAALTLTLWRCSAQQWTDRDPDAIATMLNSGDTRSVAWGAFYASAAFDTAAIPTLTRLANRWQTLVPESTNADGIVQFSDAQIETRDEMASILCALIHLDGPLPRDTVRALAHDFPSETAIFLARMPASDSADLRMEFFRDPTNHTATLRYVAAALLAREPQPGFAAELMNGIRVRANVQVISPGTRPGGSGFSGDCGTATSRRSDGWPPTQQYGIRTYESEDSFEIVGGAEPVYATRLVVTHYDPHRCGDGVFLSADRRQRLVAEMLGVKPEKMPWQVAVYRTIEYLSQPQYETDLLAFVNGEIEKQRATTSALADKGLVTPADVTKAMPEILVLVQDAREERTAPLAEVTNLPQRVIYDRYHAWPEE